MASGTVGNTAFTQLSPMDDPTFADLFGQAAGSIPGSLPGIEQLIAQGMNSPLLQLVLGPALERLKAPQAQQREQFTESARAAGGLRDSSYRGGMNKLMQNQGQAQNDLMSQVIQQILGTLVSGQLQSQQNSFLPARSMTDLLRTATPQTVQGSMAGMGGGGGGGGASSIGRSSILQPGQDYGNYAAGNAITQPGVGAAYGDSSGSSYRMPGAQISQPPAQYNDPWASFGGGSGSGGGWYDIGGGQTWLGNTPDQYGFTQADWAADPYYNDF